MTSKEVLSYLQTLGEDIRREAEQVQVMLQIAEEQGVEVDVNRDISEFEPTREFESQLVNIRGRISNIKAELYKQGMRVTYDELERRLHN